MDDLSNFDSLNDDLIYQILCFAGKTSYFVFGKINRRCLHIYNSHNIPKKTFLYGYMNLYGIKKIVDFHFSKKKYHDLDEDRLGKGVVYYNRNDVLRWLISSQYEQKHRSRGNRLNAEQQQQKVGGLLTGVCRIASFNGRQDILNEVFENSKQSLVKEIKNDPRLCRWAAASGNLELLRYLRQNECTLDYTASNSAAHSGQLEILRWLKQEEGQKDVWDSNTSASAAGGGHVDVLVFLKAEGCALNYKFCSLNAAAGGHISVLKWIKRNAQHQGCILDGFTCGKAAEFGQLETLRWLHYDQGCPLDEWTCERAADGGQIHVLKWLCENQCPKSSRAIKLAREWNHVEVVEWLEENNFEDYSSDEDY